MRDKILRSDEEFVKLLREVKIDRIKKGLDKKLRFFIKGNPFVS